jgi:phosphoglycolate phosphatase-like HAD superfamily hydrolase
MLPRPVGFDLDMTLIDSRPQILASFRVLAAETGVAIDAAVVAGRLGLKLEDELGNWFPLPAIPAATSLC